nr:retrotransposon Gag domain, retroviral aspartyl protease [Tanacetum cinerariifolium]
MEYWEDLVRALQKNFRPTEFQNPDEYLCSLKQTGTVQEYRTGTDGVMVMESKTKGTHLGIIKGIAHIIRLLFPPLVMEIREGSRCVFPTFPCVFRPFKTLCFVNYALMIRQDYDITSSLRRGALQKQTGTVQEYRQEFAKRSSRVSNWLEHCLLGVFLNGLKEELKADVRIQKPRT